jgi:hypothetical protein
VPAVGFGISNCLFDLLLRMSSSSHAAHPQTILSLVGCQVTTYPPYASSQRPIGQEARSTPVLYIITGTNHALSPGAYPNSWLWWVLAATRRCPDVARPGAAPRGTGSVSPVWTPDP